MESAQKILIVVSILVFLVFLTPNALAQSKLDIFTNSTHHSATSSVIIQNEYLKIEVGNNGQYRGWTSAGDAIFYPYGTYPWSSFMTIKVNGSIYDNAPYSSNLDNYLTQETVKKSPVETETKWYIPEENLEITQNIILVGEQAKFILKLKNKGTAAKTVSVRYEWDTQIADNDGAPLREEGGDLHEFEIAFEPVTFSYWSAYARPEPGSLVIYATWDTTPDKIIFAHWPEAYRTLWDYSWSSSRRFYTPGYTYSPYSDSCVLMYWKDIILSPGEEKSIVTYYGTTVGGGVNVDILDILTKNLYEPEESIFIYVMVTSDGKFIDNLQKSAFKVSLDGSRVDILKFISLKIPLFEVPLYKLEIKAPQEEGRHDISVRVETGTGWGSDSVKIDVFKPFTFVHMTDVHIGEKPWWWSEWSRVTSTHCPRPCDVGERRFADAIQCMNMIRPDFILITGDLVNYEGREGYRFYQRFIQILGGLESSIKVYMVPGNHDWYEEPSQYFPCWTRGDLSNYNKIINDYMDKTVSRSYLIEPNNYTFSYGGFLFIGLDSGYAKGHCGSDGGSGLTNEQMNALSGLDDSIPKIIFMHYPAIDDSSSNCIQTNRDGFIRYCVEKNVQIVLTGHTHANKIFNSRGERVIQIEPVEVNSNERPLFIQTPSVTCDDNNYEHGFRVIDCSRSKGVMIHQYQYTPILENIWIEAFSPVNLHVYDAEGRHTGINMTTGEYERDIPHSFYLTGFTYETYNENNETVNVTVPEMTILYNTTWDYMIKVTANLTEEEKLSPEIETFNLTLRRQTNDSLTTISYYNVPVYENTTASVNFNLTTTNYTMCIDYDGDGNVDDLREPDSVDIDYAPDVRIISPQNNSHFLEGEKITFKGEGIDPEDGILTNDSLMWYSDINGAIGAGNEINVSLSPGMHHITLLAKDSSDQIKTDSITIFVRSTQPDMFVDILSGNETPEVGEEHESIVKLISNRSYNFTIYIKNTGYGTLNNVSLVTNVNITKDIGDIEEGGERFVHIRFTPTQPGILTLKVTVKSKEIERNATRGLIINNFPLIVETDKDIYMQGEIVMITTNTTNENPEVSYVDLRMNITIQGQNITETYSRPILYISSLGTQEISFSWDTTGKPAGNYTITARLIEQSNSSVVLSEASTSFEITIGAIAIETATGTGIAYFTSDNGIIENLVALTESDLPEENPNVDFPHGLFSFNITGLNPNQTVNITIAFPQNIPTTAQYWKYGPNGSIDNPQQERWYQIPMGSNDGDNIITITLQDGGIGDDDGVANGVIVDQGGPGIPTAVARVPTLTPIGIIALAGLLLIVGISRIKKRK